MKFFNKINLTYWYRTAGIIGILFGIFYAFFGLESLPVYKLFVPNDVYTPWSNGLYGSVFIGFSVLLYFVGQLAFKKKDKELMKALLFGVLAWLTVEALFSMYYGIYINVLVDVMLFIVLGCPLLKGMKSK